MSTRIKRLTFEMLYGEVKSKILDYRKNFTFSKGISPSMPNLTLPPTTLWAGQFPSREDCDLKVRVHAGLAAGRAAKRPLQPVVRHDWIFPTF
jgi:hypothetical protein